MRLVWALCTVLVVSCNAVPDRYPPKLLSAEVADDGTELQVRFDEPVQQTRAEVDESPVQPVVVEGATAHLKLPTGWKPGSGHVWSAEAEDEQHNATSVAGKVYAPNPHPGRLRLNEVRIAGTGSHTDFVELRAEVDGNLGGWTVEVWSSPTQKQRLVLPGQAVVAGDLIVVRYRPPAEAVDTAAGTLEYWQADAKGLPGSKGLIVLRPRPDGLASDGLLYSKKPGEAATWAGNSGWTGPELDPSACTATRTWNRDDEGQWLVSATGGATPGAANKLKAWEAPPSNRGGSSKTKRRIRRGAATPTEPSRPAAKSRGDREEPLVAPQTRRPRSDRTETRPVGRASRTLDAQLRSPTPTTDPRRLLPEAFGPSVRGEEGRESHRGARREPPVPAETEPAASPRWEAATPRRFGSFFSPLMLLCSHDPEDQPLGRDGAAGPVFGP